MNADVKAKWVEALESGKYEQGQYQLRQPAKEGEGHAYCCLGVLCDLLEPDGWEGNSHDGSLCAPGYPIQDAAGIPRGETLGRLVIMNDSEGRSFHEIAQYIRENL